MKMLKDVSDICNSKSWALLSWHVLYTQFVENGNANSSWERQILLLEISTLGTNNMIFCMISTHLISATLDPPLPMMQPISSLGTVISWVCCWAGFLFWPVSRARAEHCKIIIKFNQLDTAGIKLSYGISKFNWFWKQITAIAILSALFN